jgi:hypothetical protein
MLFFVFFFLINYFLLCISAYLHICITSLCFASHCSGLQRMQRMQLMQRMQRMQLMQRMQQQPASRLCFIAALQVCSSAVLPLCRSAGLQFCSSAVLQTCRFLHAASLHAAYRNIAAHFFFILCVFL